MKKKLAVLSALFVLLFAGVALADPVETTIYYQKKLAKPLKGATKTIEATFSLWDSETGGTTPIWQETKQVAEGTKLITTMLGDTVPLPEPMFGQQLWVQVEANGTVLGSRDTLGLGVYGGVVPYALWSASGNPGATGPQGPAGPLNPNIITDANSDNTGIGISALNSNTTGLSNTAIGYDALNANTTGSQNTASNSRNQVGRQLYH